ncbi:MAG: hypothetical protein PHC88_09705 [Terrimicrobiaceae bacterium]|nr:hypothetical protein [Terrimicrobiaceae bacterium]
MKRTRVAATIGAATLFAGGAFANLVPNPDLDLRAQNALAAWKYIEPNGFQSIPLDAAKVSSTGVKISRLGEPAGSGRYFLRLETDGRKGDESVTLSSGQYKVPTGFTYEMACEVRARGLMPENGDRSKYASAMVSVFCDGREKRIDARRTLTFSNTPDWTAMAKLQIAVPDGTEFIQIRPAIANKYPGNPVCVDFRKFAFVPVDFALPNASFEQTNGDGSLKFWRPYGSTACTVVNSPAHGGSRAVEVKDAPAGLFSGWSAEVPVRQDREYVFKGFAKGGVLDPGGPIGGGALGLQFLDANGLPVGAPCYSKATPANSGWVALATPKAIPPIGAFTARLTAGMQYCRGSSWFDDLSLEMSPVAAADAVKVLRPDPKPSTRVAYAKNLLTNGDVETGDATGPTGWTYIGKSASDWTAAQIDAFHGNGRPGFDIGRGRGEWSHGTVYAGTGALLNASIDPPISRKLQWYGRSPVDGYWLSNPMACAPGKPYIAAAWLRPGANIVDPWCGPLEIQFFDRNGRQVPAAGPVRSILNGFSSNEWGYWFTPPCIAPSSAATMRLRFGQELAADRGGWGRTYADDLAVWEIPAEGNLAQGGKIFLDNLAARAWFSTAHAKIKPPYLPSPAEALEYESVWGTVSNTAPGNLFRDPKGDVAVRLSLFNVLGEDRRVSVRVVRTDWKGNASAEVVSPSVKLPAFSQAAVEIKLPPMGGYGAFRLDCTLMEGSATVGSCSGRYAVIPPLERKRTQENIWAVTLLRAIEGDNSPGEQELASVLRVAGFGIGWVREYDKDSGATAMREIRFFRSLGMKVILQVQPPLANWSPARAAAFDPAPFYEYGRKVATRCKGLVVAYGDWGIEQSNNRTAQQPVYRPIKDGQFLSDREYDEIWIAIHDGIRSVDKETPILIGNIATDFEANAIKRMYGDPVNGRFDGAILNAYMGLISVAQRALAEFDKHGDRTKSIWQEENADQRSPITGPGRRYGEGEGAANLVRSWISLACKAHPRIRAITQWGFSPRNRQDDMADATMMDIGLQPRPHFVAHAIMADALADAAFRADLSTPAAGLFEFKRPDGPLLVAWADAGEREMTFDTSGHDLTVMDIMGNRTVAAAQDGRATVRLGVSPVYIFGAPSILIGTKPKSGNASR